MAYQNESIYWHVGDLKRHDNEYFVTINTHFDLK